jgi:hypothetical protein
MRTILCAFAVLGLVVSAQAADVTSVNPSGVVKDMTFGSPIPVQDIICGALDYDGVNGLAGARRQDGTLESWILAWCPQAGGVGGVQWLAIDNTEQDWVGLDDVAAWDQSTVEGGTATDGNAAVLEFDIPNERAPLMDDNGNQVVIFGRLAWIYTIFPYPNAFAGGYFSARAVIGTGQSFILTRPCGGEDKPIWFLSTSFGYSPAVPGNVVFGVDYCACMVVFAGGDPEPHCMYEVAKPKLKNGPCGEVCEVCPYEKGQILCKDIACENSDQCPNKLGGFVGCVGGGACKVKAALIGCEPCWPDCK